MAALKELIKKVPGAIALARIVLRILRRMTARLHPRKPKIDILAQVLLNKDVPSQTELENVRRMASNSIAVSAVLEQRLGNDVKAREMIAGLKDSSLLRDRIIKRIWSSMSDLGRHDIALDALFRIRGSSTNDIEKIQHRIDHINYSSSAYDYYSKFLDKYDAADPKGYVVVFDLGSRVTTGLMVPMGLSLIKQGYHVCSAVASTMPKSARPELAEVSGVLRTSGSALTTEPWNTRKLHNDWNVDWESGVVECDGVNYFTFFLERISKLKRSYRGDLSTPQAKALFDDILRKSDLALVICKRLLAVSRLGKPIRIVTMDTHFAPWGIIRRWCELYGQDHGIHLVGLSIAYENYFSNLTSVEASTVSVEDMTAQSELRHPFLGGRYRFQQYLKSSESANLSRDEVLSWIKVNRSRINAESKVQRDNVLNRISAARSQGKKVFCAMGKVLIDFAAPDDVGNVFGDFESWVNELVNFSSESGALLLIKPHPHEVRAEIVQGGVQCLRDLLPDDLPESVIYLEHSSFNSSEVADLVDGAFVWNGTVCSEFPVLGCPVAAESIWASRDYPLDSHIIKSKSEYRDIFEGKRNIPLSNETVSRATAHLHFMKSPCVAIPFKYVRRAGTNQQIGPNIFYDDQIASLEKFGDPNVELAASRFFEFATDPAKSGDEMVAN